MNRRKFLKNAGYTLAASGLYLPKVKAGTTIIPGTTARGITVTTLGPIPDVAWWKFSEGSGATAHDSSGNGLDGAFINSPTWGSSGFNYSTFNGSSQFVDTGLQNLNLASGSISWWMNPSTAYNSGTVRAIWSQNANDPSGVPDFTAQVYSDDNWYIGWNTSGNDARVTVAASAANYAMGSWHLYVFTWSASGSALWVDTTQIATKGTAPTVSNMATDFFIGHQQYQFSGTVNEWFPGSIADFRIFSHTLTSTEISSLRSAGAQ